MSLPGVDPIPWTVPGPDTKATMAALGSIELASLERSVVALVGDAEGRAAFFQRVAQAVPEIG